MTSKAVGVPPGGDGVSLTLYIGGAHPTSARATETVEAALESHQWLRGRLRLIDVFDEPRAALGAGVVATPSLLAADGERRLWMIGDFEDKAELEEALNALIARDLAVSQDWITEAELDARPELVKTMSVQPPRGAGQIRLVRIGEGADQVDLQPCGGTHVARTGEIGRVRLGKIEKKGRQNRRVSLHLQD